MPQLAQFEQDLEWFLFGVSVPFIIQQRVDDGPVTRVYKRIQLR